MLSTLQMPTARNVLSTLCSEYLPHRVDLQLCGGSVGPNGGHRCCTHVQKLHPSLLLHRGRHNIQVSSDWLIAAGGMEACGTLLHPLRHETDHSDNKLTGGGLFVGGLRAGLPHQGSKPRNTH
jgi:hypothetical protein